MLNFEEVKGCLKQRFPIMMVDRVIEMEPSKSIKALKNVTGNEIHFMGHFPDYAIVPGVFIIEAIAQSASILFSSSTGKGMDQGELMVLGSVGDMRFLAPVLPGYTMIMEVNIIKMVEEAAIVEGVAMVDGNVVAKGKLTFARKKI
ncbi:MAG: 3-hydroxyacyl-ACP dehydratase FabZ [Clostridia bacterium]|nr:3-hydroxyacyl-ACP dehydratase FabZ [Clostridia bacterium]